MRCPFHFALPVVTTFLKLPEDMGDAELRANYWEKYVDVRTFKIIG